MQPTRSVWTEHSLREAPRDARPAASRRGRWPMDSRIVMLALACCAAGAPRAAVAQDTVPWRVVSVSVDAYVSGRFMGDDGYYSCYGGEGSNGQTWQNEAGLFGAFSVTASATYECCRKDYYGYSYDCTSGKLYASAAMDVGANSISVWASGCMEYDVCFEGVGFTVVFDRPMRMVWDRCCGGNDCCYDNGCAIDGSPCGDPGSEEFPGASILSYNGYQYGHYFTTYAFIFDGGPGQYSFAENIRFERMFPADVVPDRLVDGSDIAAILSKWGSGYDPQRTPEDVNLDGQVGAEDLALVLFAWGTPG